MNKIEEFLQRLTLQGIHLWPQEGKLRYAGPQEQITPEVLSQLKTHKSELLRQLSEPIYAPLSVGQRGLWFIQQQAPENSAYTVTVAYRILTVLDVGLLRDTIQLLVNRHAALRTRFIWQAEALVQQIDGYQAAEIEVIDHADCAEADIQQQVQAFHERPFDLSSGPLLRTAILRHSEQNNTLVLSVHHILVDGWSIYQLVDELFTFYAALCRGVVVELPIIEHTYAEYVVWQQELLAREETRLLAYWQTQLGGELPVLQLPTDFPRPPQQTLRGISQPIHLSSTLTEQLKQVARQNHCTLYILLLAAYQLLLHRYSGQTDILVGLPMAGRSRPEFSEIIGYFVSPVVVRADLQGNPTFAQVLARVKEQVFAALDHQDYPFARLVEQLNPQRDPSRSPIFQANFVLQKPHRAQALMQQSNMQEQFGLILEPIPFTLFAGQDDIGVELIETSDGLVGVLEGNAALFTPETLVRMAGHYQVLLAGIVAEDSLGVNQPIAHLPLLTEAERHQLLVEWNDTTADYPKDTCPESTEGKCIHHIFEEQVERTPDAIAVVMAENKETRRQRDKERSLESIQTPNAKRQNQLTYAELNVRANQLAHHLQSLGVGPEVLVGICVERSVEMVVGLLGILKAGGAYVPLDPTYPAERLAYMLQNSQAAVLVTQAKFAHHFADSPVQTLYLDTAGPLLAQQCIENITCPVNPNHLAYVIYTSGSTGQPKGVMIEHQALAKHALNVGRVYGITPKDNILQFSAFSFDAAQEQIFEALCNGATLVLREDLIWTGEEFTQKIVEYAITLVELTPTYFQGLINVWQQNRPAFLDGDLRLLQVSSEALLPATARQWQQLSPTTRLLNIYGPTEATVTATGFELTDYRPEVWPINLPIGRPFPGRTAYILDSNLQPVPVGVYGELYLGGDSVGRGYLNRPELTAERFIDNPFCTLSFSGQSPDKLYKTGDVVRWIQNPDDCPASPPNIEFVGRVDGQVKLRGLRIEFGEIEYALTEHPQIDYAVVLLHEVTNEDKRLVAYVVPKGQNNETIAGSDAPAILRNYLSQKLPTYMIPNAFIILDHFPLMPNGKIDRNALLTPDMRALAISREVIPPQTATEKALSMLFESILKVEDVGIQDDFFALGGHSLLLTQLFFQLRENFQVDCRLQDLFLMPTITQLANFIDSGQQEKPNRQVLDLNVEAILDPTIRSNQTTSSQISVQQEFMYTKPSSIFLTGATGFLGAFLLYELLGQTQANIFCLVRCMDEQDGMSRLQNNLEQYGLWQEAYRERMNAISGDLSLPLFGLEVGQFNALASKIDVIYHNAALVNLIQPYEGLKSVNVVGTQDIIRLAAQNRFTTPIHYVSTLSVFDTIDAFDGRRFHEEDDLGTGRDLFSGYAQSKWVAEKLLLEAKRRGIPVTIYRPGIISGQSQTGVWNTQDWLPLYLKGWTQLGEWPETELGVYLVPVDYVSSALVTLSLAPTNQNRIFHLENPYPIQYRQFAQWLNDFGYSVQKMSIDRWLDKLTKTVSGSSDHALMPLLAMFVTESLDATKPSMIDIFKNGQLPQFDCSNTLAGLAHTDITCPRVDAKLFQTYLSYYIQTGFLEAPSGTPPNKQVAFNSHQK